MSFVLLDLTFRRHRKVSRLAETLKIRRAEAAGLLASLWLTVREQAPSGELTGWTAKEVEEAADWQGEPGRLLHALQDPRHRFLDTVVQDNPALTSSEANSCFHDPCQVVSPLVVHDWADFTGSAIGRRIEELEAKEDQGPRTRALRARDPARRPGRDPGRDPGRERAPASEIRSQISDLSLSLRTGSLSPVESSSRKYANSIANEQLELATPSAPIVTPEAIVGAWRRIAVPAGLDDVLRLTPQRVRAMQARLRSESGRDLAWWEALFARIASSSFLGGANDRGWRASLNWALVEYNVIKVLEGAYDDRKPKRPSTPPSTTGQRWADMPVLTDRVK